MADDPCSPGCQNGAQAHRPGRQGDKHGEWSALSALADLGTTVGELTYRGPQASRTRYRTGVGTQVMSPVTDGFSMRLKACMSPEISVPASAAGKAPMWGASPRKHRARARRTAPALVATGTLAVSVLVGVPNGVGAQTEAPSGYSSAASIYCARIPAPRVSSVVGATVALLEAVDVKPTLECIYEGGPGIVAVDKEPGVPAAHGVTLAKAEATAASAFPKGTKVTFSPLPSLSPTAFKWAALVEGIQFNGISTTKGGEGYGSEMSGELQLSKLERLLQLAAAA